MQLATNVYIRRNGNMRFWRFGRLGGSLYVASATSNPAAKREAKAARRASHKAAMDTLRRAVQYAETLRG